MGCKDKEVRYEESSSVCFVNACGTIVILW